TRSVGFAIMPRLSTIVDGQGVFSFGRRRIRDTRSAPCVRLTDVSRIWLCFVTFVVCASGASAPLETIFKGVEARYNKAQSLQVLFHESFSAPQRPKMMESGTLRLRKPGRMRWDYSDPAGKLFLADGKNIYLYTPKDNQVEKMNMKE